MFVFDDDFVERVVKTTSLSEWQIRHAAKELIAAGLVQDLGANLLEVPKLEPEKVAEKIAEIRRLMMPANSTQDVPGTRSHKVMSKSHMASGAHPFAAVRLAQRYKWFTRAGGHWKILRQRPRTERGANRILVLVSKTLWGENVRGSFCHG